jgi:hypothetical protein
MTLVDLSSGQSFCSCCGSEFFDGERDIDEVQGIMLTTNINIEPWHPHQVKTIVETPHGPLGVFIISTMTDDDIERQGRGYQEDEYGDEEW